MSLTLNHDINSISASTQILLINNTGAVIVPKGTTATRPVTPQTGMLRYNTTSEEFEGYKPSGWTAISAAATPATQEAVAFSIVFGG